ncbi:DUF2515 family protein [Pseudomonas sp. NPDC089743]|uniref:DUF2515 family protein n=1 Tax=Pseudomonas sp. NPDC089743 TaxID=3364471 RepID=UPI0037FABD5A
MPFRTPQQIQAKSFSNLFLLMWNLSVTPCISRATLARRSTSSNQSSANYPDPRDGFGFIYGTEHLQPGKLRREMQYESLMAIARHEQLVILQPLIYNSLGFKTLLRGQALWEAI